MLLAKSLTQDNSYRVFEVLDYTPYSSPTAPPLRHTHTHTHAFLAKNKQHDMWNALLHRQNILYRMRPTHLYVAVFSAARSSNFKISTLVVPAA